MLAAIFEVSIVPYICAFELNDLEVLGYYIYILDILWLINIYVNCVTAYQSDMKTVTKFSDILKRYARSAAIFDIISMA